MCIRQEPGFCCVRYMPCPGEPMAFTLDINANAVLGMGFVDNLCTRDYVGIEGKKMRLKFLLSSPNGFYAVSAELLQKN